MPKLSASESETVHIPAQIGEELEINPAFVRLRGSGFLKRWMAFLEDQADLRYPDAGELL